MSNYEIIKLYNQGYSINYIVDQYYNLQKKKNIKNIYSSINKRILIIDDDYLKKIDCRRFIEEVIYNYLINNECVEQF